MMSETKSVVTSPSDDRSGFDAVVMRIIEDAYVNLEHQLFSEYKGYEIELERDDEDDHWYIRVRPVEEGYLYDGWWRGSEGESKENAVREALRGAQILGA